MANTGNNQPKSELHRNGELDANEVKEDNTLDESNLENEGPVDIDHYQINTAEQDLKSESDSDFDVHDWIDAEQMAYGKIKNDQLRKQDEIRRLKKANDLLEEAVRKRARAENVTSIEYLKKQEEEFQEKDKKLRKQLDDNADSMARNKRLQLCAEKKNEFATKSK